MSRPAKKKLPIARAICGDCKRTFKQKRYLTRHYFTCKPRLARLAATVSTPVAKTVGQSRPARGQHTRARASHWFCGWCQATVSLSSFGQTPVTHLAHACPRRGLWRCLYRAVASAAALYPTGLSPTPSPGLMTFVAAFRSSPWVGDPAAALDTAVRERVAAAYRFSNELLSWIASYASLMLLDDREAAGTSRVTTAIPLPLHQILSVLQTLCLDHDGDHNSDRSDNSLRPGSSYDVPKNKSDREQWLSEFAAEYSRRAACVEAEALLICRQKKLTQFSPELAIRNSRAEKEWTLFQEHQTILDSIATASQAASIAYSEQPGDHKEGQEELDGESANTLPGRRTTKRSATTKKGRKKKKTKKKSRKKRKTTNVRTPSSKSLDAMLQDFLESYVIDGDLSPEANWPGTTTHLYMTEARREIRSRLGIRRDIFMDWPCDALPALAFMSRELIGLNLMIR